MIANRFIIFLTCAFLAPFAANADTYLTRIQRVPGATYTSIQDAYNAATTGDTIQAQSGWFDESLTFNRDISVTIEGGYNSDFTYSTGEAAVVIGSMSSALGQITVDNVTLSSGNDGQAMASSLDVNIINAQNGITIHDNDTVTFSFDPLVGAPAATEYCFSINNTVVGDWSVQSSCNWVVSGCGEFTLKVEARYPNGYDSHQEIFYVYRQPVNYPS
ncbi:MAG: hypothetical protein GY858_00940 [Candidatus Omnitrophica bacterium]|nr:hypothetical protein [Candidatus Omnitrophota bacterium]